MLINPCSGQPFVIIHDGSHEHDRGRPFSTYAQKGGVKNAYALPIPAMSKIVYRKGGVKNHQYFAYVLNGRPHTIAMNSVRLN